MLETSGKRHDLLRFVMATMIERSPLTHKHELIGSLPTVKCLSDIQRHRLMLELLSCPSTGVE